MIFGELSGVSKPVRSGGTEWGGVCKRLVETAFRGRNGGRETHRKKSKRGIQREAYPE